MIKWAIHLMRSRLSLIIGRMITFLWHFFWVSIFVPLCIHFLWAREPDKGAGQKHNIVGSRSPVWVNKEMTHVRGMSTILQWIKKSPPMNRNNHLPNVAQSDWFKQGIHFQCCSVQLEVELCDQLILKCGCCFMPFMSWECKWVEGVHSLFFCFFFYIIHFLFWTLGLDF